jgi:hypothetical protein
LIGNGLVGSRLVNKHSFSQPREQLIVMSAVGVNAHLAKVRLGAKERNFFSPFVSKGIVLGNVRNSSKRVLSFGSIRSPSLSLSSPSSTSMMSRSVALPGSEKP